MALQVSNGFKALILGPRSFESIFAGGAIAVYSGARPDTADDPIPVGAVLLGHITTNGLPWSALSQANGLTYARQGPFVTKPIGVPWAITPTGSGLATWFRVLSNTPDNGSLSFDLARIDGDISPSNPDAEMRLLNPVLQVGVVKTLDHFLYTIPPVVGL
jgi:hypothetical protein